MEKNLEDYRKSYEKAELTRERLQENPLTLFKQWFDEVESTGGVDETNAMTLSTVGKDGFPKSRVVLLKKLTDQGFVFYTNYESEKGIAIANHPNVCLSFFWPSAERQVIVKGIAEKVPGEISDHYFYSRPKGSQLGAIASHQSQPIPNREVLEQRLSELEEKHATTPIKRPEYWGGYLVKPVEVEFWQGRPNRLHDRFSYSRQEQGVWTIVRLAP